MHVQIVCNTDIRGGCPVIRTNCGRKRYNPIQMVLGIPETVSFNVSLSFEIWVYIQALGGVGLMVLKVAGEYLERKVNCDQKVFVWMRHV